MALNDPGKLTDLKGGNGMMPKPLSIGTPFDGSHIVEVMFYDDADDVQPFQYRLADGRAVWID